MNMSRHIRKTPSGRGFQAYWAPSFWPTDGGFSASRGPPIAWRQGLRRLASNNLLSTARRRPSWPVRRPIGSSVRCTETGTTGRPVPALRLVGFC